MTERTTDPAMVICPNCVHQFRAIPEDVQDELSALRRSLAVGAEPEDMSGPRQDFERSIYEANPPGDTSAASAVPGEPIIEAERVREDGVEWVRMSPADAERLYTYERALRSHCAALQARVEVAEKVSRLLDASNADLMRRLAQANHDLDTALARKEGE